MTSARTSETGTTFEPCYCKHCQGNVRTGKCPHPREYPYQRLSWWRLLWRRIWCPLDGHGGIAWDSNMPACNAAHPFCKRCGAKVRLIA